MPVDVEVWPTLLRERTVPLAPFELELLDYGPGYALLRWRNARGEVTQAQYVDAARAWTWDELRQWGARLEFRDLPRWFD